MKTNFICLIAIALYFSAASVSSITERLAEQNPINRNALGTLETVFIDLDFCLIKPTLIICKNILKAKEKSKKYSKRLYALLLSDRTIGESWQSFWCLQFNRICN